MTERSSLGYNDPNDVEGQLIQLRDSNEALSAEVRALTSTLRVVQELEAEQTVMKRQAEKAELRIKEVDTATQERITRTRTAGVIAAAVAVVAIPLVSILVYLSLIDHVNELLSEQRHNAVVLLNQQNHNSYVSCNTRNQGTIENADREETLAKIESDPRAIRVHSQSAVKLRLSIIDCSRFLKVVTK